MFISNISGLTELSTGKTKSFYFDPQRTKIDFRMKQISNKLSDGKMSVYINLLSSSDQGLGYFEMFYEVKGGKIKDAQLKHWIKETPQGVCTRHHAMQKRWVPYISWQMWHDHRAVVTHADWRRMNANFNPCPDQNKMRELIKHNKVSKASLTYTVHGSGFKASEVKIFYRVEYKKNWGSGSVMLLSHNKRAEQSSTHGHGHAKNAVDGRTDHRYGHRYVT